jgi:hypothetical protein
VYRNRWIVAPLTAVMVLLGLTIGVSPAAAATATGQACNYDYVTFNACLNMFPATSRPYTTAVSAGIDLKMSRVKALLALSQGSSFRATLYTNTNGRHAITVLPVLAGWPQAGATGLGAQFGLEASNEFLNQGNRGENVFQLEIEFFEVHIDGTTTTYKYTTGSIRGTLPQCRFICPAAA